MLWIKALHIVFIASWFAGLFYLPRIFVNLAMVAPGSLAERERLLLMAGKLLRFTTILAVPALALGVWLWLGYGIGRGPGNGWMHAKLMAVLLVVGYHHACSVLLRKFVQNRNTRSHRWFRWFNEVPVLLLLAIVVLVSCTIVEVFHLHLGYWILLTALFVCQPNYSATKSRVNQRIVGTVLGVVVGSLVPYFTPSVETKLWIVIAATTLFFFFRTNKYSFSTFFITIQALTSFSLAGLDVYAALPLRIIDTLIGAAIAWVAVSYLWPDWRYLTLERTAGRAIANNGAYLRVILDQLQNGSIDDIAYRSARRQTHERAAALSSTLSDMSSEPKKYAHRLPDGFHLLKLNYTLISYISALGAYRSHMHQGSDAEFSEPFYRLAYRVADLLDHINQPDAAAFHSELAHNHAQLLPQHAALLVVAAALGLKLRQLLRR